MIRPPVGKVTYADGVTWGLQPILVSGNGWVYKPDDLRTEHEIKRGKNKTFPRSDGRYDADQYLKDETKNHFVDRRWEKPIAISDPVKYPSLGYGDSLVVAWLDSVWGWTSSTLHIKQEQGSHLISYRLDMHGLAGWMVHRSTVGANHLRAEANVADIPRAVSNWIKDPLGLPLGLLAESIGERWSQVLDIPSNLGNLAFGDGDDWHNPDEDVISTHTGNGLFYREGVIEKVFESDHNWKQLNELFSALKFVGFKIRPRWSYTHGDRHLTGITIAVPERDGMLGHTMSIYADNPHVDIECGYQQDENRWLDRKQREAVTQMADLERDLEVISYEIKL